MGEMGASADVVPLPGAMRRLRVTARDAVLNHRFYS